VNNVSDDLARPGRIGAAHSTNGRLSEEYETKPRLNGELSLVIRVCGRRIMSENVSDQSLLKVGGLGLCEPLDEDDSALARALRRILASSTEGPVNSFQASI
jgi:hypothetical protein